VEAIGLLLTDVPRAVGHLPGMSFTVGAIGGPVGGGRGGEEAMEGRLMGRAVRCQ
jgi:hypothetical protein